MISNPKAKFPSHHAPPARQIYSTAASRERVPSAAPTSRDLAPHPQVLGARPPPGPARHTPCHGHPTAEFSPLPSAPANQPFPEAEVGELQVRAQGRTPPTPPRTGGLARRRTPRFAKLQKWTERLRGPLGTPSTFREERCDAAGAPRGGALGEATHDGLTPPSRPPAAAAPAAPGPAPGHPAPTARRRAPLFSRGPRRPAPSLAPVPGAPRAPLLGRAVPPSPSAPPPQRGPTPFPAAATSPQPAAPHRVSATAGGHAQAAAPARPATALRAARSRLLQPGTRRDIRARIPTPGLFLGVRPRPDRNSFFAARVRTARTPWCPSAGLASPFLSASSLSSLSRGPLLGPISPLGGS